MSKLKIKIAPMRGKQQGSLLIKVFGVLIIGAIVLSAYYLYLAKIKLKQEKLPKPVPIETVVKQMEKDGVLLKLDRTDTLAGIDADNNGIRDDIDEYIRQTFKDEAQRKAVEQLAKASQAKLLVDLTDEDAINAARLASTRAINCLGDRLITGERGKRNYDAFDKVSKKIIAMTSNTKARATQQLKFSEALSGSVWGLPDGDTCDE